MDNLGQKDTPPKTWWQRILRGIKFGGIVITLGCVVIVCVALYSIAFGTQSERGSHSLRGRASRAAAKALTNFYAGNGFYPPKPDGHAYYGAWDDSLVIPFKVEPSMLGDYKGPIIDPFRQTAVFPGEVLKKVHYTGSRNPESDKLPWKFFHGYAPRYYRSQDGQTAFLVSNGPDRDIDVGVMELEASLSTSAALVWQKFIPLTYDPTNGTGYNGTNGDLVEIVNPDR